MPSVNIGLKLMRQVSLPFVLFHFPLKRVRIRHQGASEWCERAKKMYIKERISNFPNNFHWIGPFRLVFYQKNRVFYTNGTCLYPIGLWWVLRWLVTERHFEPQKGQYTNLVPRVSLLCLPLSFQGKQRRETLGARLTIHNSRFTFVLRFDIFDRWARE